jgi:hypothetical protein
VDYAEHPGITGRYASGNVGHYGRHQYVTDSFIRRKSPSLPVCGYRSDMQLGGINPDITATLEYYAFMCGHAEQFSSRADKSEQQPRIIVYGTGGESPID